MPLYNPLLITLSREYLDTIHAIQRGKFSTSRQLHDLEGQRGTLHDQLLRAVHADDYAEAELDTYSYARQVVAWARGKG